MTFRSIDKVHLSGRVPPVIDSAIRERGYHQKRSVSEVMTELLATGLGFDPRDFGIAGEPKTKPVSAQ